MNDRLSCECCSLPKDQSIRKKWLDWLCETNSVAAQELPKHVYLCDLHFSPEMKMSKRLTKGAVPSTFCHKDSASDGEVPQGRMMPNASNSKHAGTLHRTAKTVVNERKNSQEQVSASPSKMNFYMKKTRVTDQHEGGRSNDNLENQVNQYTASVVVSVAHQGHVEPHNLNVTIHDQTACLVNEIQMRNENFTSITEIYVNTDDEISMDIEQQVREMTNLPMHKPLQAQHFETFGNASNTHFHDNNATTKMQHKFNVNKDLQFSSTTIVDTNFDSHQNPINVTIFEKQCGIHSHLWTNKTVMLEPFISIEDLPSNHKNEEDTNKESELQFMKAKSKQCCSVLGCESQSKDVKHFTFPAIAIAGVLHPANIERCKEWVRATGNVELTKLHTTQLHKNHFVCIKHFNDKQFYNEKCLRLKPNAVPTEFLQKILTDDQMKEFPKFGSKQDIFARAVRQLSFEDFNNANKSHESNETGHQDIEKKFDTILTNGKIKDRHYRAFETDMKKLKQYTCHQCKETFWSKYKPKRNCLHSEENCKKLSASNGMDPGEMPDELKGLTGIEEALISPVHVMLSVYKIKGHQYGYSGNVINFPQPVEGLAEQLPHKVADLPSIITVRTQATGDAPQDFHVRSDKIYKALMYLKEHHPDYQNISISEENLSLLPEDGNVYEHVPFVSIPEKENEQEDMVSDSEDSETNCATPTETNYQESFIPVNPTSNQDDQIKGMINWPPVDASPVNEFGNTPFVSRAFPCLFPNGKADLREKRDHKISDSAYFQHLLRYQDGRFAKHPKFRFYAMNSLMRWNAIEKGSLYVKRNDEFENMNMDELKSKIEDNPNYLNKIMYQCANMRGTRPYWKARHQELIEMVEQIGMPSLFFTLTAADFHWPGLFKMLVPDEDINNLTEARRRELIADNPILVDKYFFERVKTFITKTVKPKFKVVEFWYRVEYQHRGSPHVHGLLWVENAPDVTNLPQKTPEELQKIVDFFDELIFTEHPDVNARTPLVHPCRIELEEVIDLKKDLAELLNTVQRHTRCTPGYCLKTKKKKNQKHQCRFKFPKDLREKTDIIFSDSGDIEYLSARNDDRLNKYNPYMILIWRANLDLAPVLSKKALINYLAKYISKSETKSKTLQELFEEISENHNKGVKSMIQKLYIRACSERDYSAQEVGHIIMSEQMVKCTRNFVNIFLKDDKNWIKVTDIENDRKSLLQKYSERPDKYEKKTLWHMAKNFNFEQKKMRQKQAVVVLYPKIKYNANKESNEDFFRQEVLLHVAWRNIEQLKTNNQSWEDVHNENLEQIQEERMQSITTTIEENLENHIPQEDEDEYTEVPYITSTEDWMAISSMRPDQTTKPVDLGKRSVDTTHNWNTAKSKYAKYGTVEELQTFIAMKKIEFDATVGITPFPDVQFNDEQQQVLNLVDRQIQAIHKQENGKEMPKSTIVQGSAGTGKSLIIKALSHKVQTAFGADSILLLTPTGIAALNIDGSTIHSKLHIDANKEFKDLQNERSRKFCTDMKNVKFIVVDEYSMVGAKMLGMIDRRLKQATGNQNENFGGLFIYFFGDVRQLPPVLDSALYSKKIPNTLLGIHGKFVWDSIPQGIVLNHVHRQSDARFKQLLANLSTGEVSQDDYELLKQRFVGNVPATERKTFDDSLKLYPTREQVSQENLNYLKNLKDPSTMQPVPVALIPANNNCQEAANGSAEDAGGLEPTLHLAPSSKIMLRSNLWTERGLVNGTIGTVVDIIYYDNEKPPSNAPAVLICRFEDYKGPFLGNDEHEKLVAIPAITKAWSTSSKELCSRTQFPVQIARAITIHKAQGLTLSKVFIDIGENREMTPGLSFVALSRAKSLDGILLKPFTLKRFMKINNSAVLGLKKMFLQSFSKKTLK